MRFSSSNKNGEEDHGEEIIIDGAKSKNPSIS